MKIDAASAAKVAAHCQSRGNFQPAMVKEAAALVNSAEFTTNSTGPEEVFLVQNPMQTRPQQGKLATRSEMAGTADIKCYICAGTWHAISACPLYPTVFSCPLCRTEPHPVTSCKFYAEWVTFKNNLSKEGNQSTNNQGSWDRNQGSWDRNTYPGRSAGDRNYQGRGNWGNYQNTPYQRNRYYSSREDNRQRYENREVRPYRNDQGPNRQLNNRGQNQYENQGGYRGQRNQSFQDRPSRNYNRVQGNY